MFPLPININLFQRSLTSTPGTLLLDLAPLCNTYDHAISATFGFESMSVNVAATLDEALDYADLLFSPVIVTDPQARIMWEGYLAQVDITVGGRSRSISLDAMANRLRVRYTTVLGTPGTTATASNTTSQGFYGVKDAVISTSETTATVAASLRDSALDSMAFPRAVPASELSTGAEADSGGVQVVLTFAGWYATLGWVLTSRTDTSTEATSTQVGALIGTASPGIGATNPVLNTATTNIVATGVNDTRLIAADTSYRQKIEDLLSKGNSANERLAWGIYENRAFTVAQWAGATPSTIGYRTRLGSVLVENGSGSLIDPWLVRPDAMVEEQDFIEVGPPSGATDLVSRFYLERVTFSIDQGGYRLNLEPAATDSLASRLARIG